MDHGKARILGDSEIWCPLKVMPENVSIIIFHLPSSIFHLHHHHHHHHHRTEIAFQKMHFQVTSKLQIPVKCPERDSSKPDFFQMCRYASIQWTNSWSSPGRKKNNQGPWRNTPKTNKKHHGLCHGDVQNLVSNQVTQHVGPYQWPCFP